MAGPILRPTDDFNTQVTVYPERLRQFVRCDNEVLLFEAEGGTRVDGDPEMLERMVRFIISQLKESGIIPIRLHSGRPQDPKRILTYEFFYLPDAIDCWAHSLDLTGTDPEPALIIEDVPFYLNEEQIADFEHDLRRQTPENDWIEFSPDAEGPLRTLDGRFCFRKSRIAGIIAAPELPLLRIAMANGSELAIPLQNAAAHIHDIAALVPGLHAIPTAEDDLRMYGDPDHYPELRPSIPDFAIFH